MSVCVCACACVCLCLCVCLCPRVRVVCASSWPSLSPPSLLLLLYFDVALVQTVQTFTCKTKFEKKRKAQKEKQKRRHRKTEKSKGQANNRIKLLGQRICSVKQSNRLAIIESTVSSTICNITYSNQCEAVQFVSINIAQPFRQYNHFKVAFSLA